MQQQLYLPVEEQNFFYKYLAYFISFFYSLIISLRNRFYDKKIFKAKKLPGRVISVGNITLGGTGKSPLVMDIAQHLLERGLSPVILTRGYKSSLKKKQSLVLLAGKVLKKNFSSEISRFPDEAMMYSHRLPSVPVIVSSDRVSAALWYLSGNAKPSHWILDDGFQHRKIMRDFDLVLLDAQKPFGNGKLFPLGSLREPVENLRRAHYIAYTRASSKFPDKLTEVRINKISPVKKEKLYFDFTLHSFENLKFNKNHEPLLLACGIAEPDRFFSQILSKGMVVQNFYPVADHEDFDEKKMNELAKECKSLVITEKDYWRNPNFFKKIKLPFFIAQLRVFPQETNTQSLFELIK